MYVDDILLPSNSELHIQSIKDHLHSTFKIKDLGVAKFLLGLEVARGKSRINVSQRKYALEVLEETGFLRVNLFIVQRSPL